MNIPLRSDKKSAIFDVVVIIFSILFCVTGNSVNAANYQATQLNTAGNCPIVNTATTLDLPHMTSAPDATNQSFISALVIMSGSQSVTNIIVCAFGDDGTFYGGSTIAINPQRRLMFTSNSSDPTAAFSSIILPAFQTVTGVTGSGAGLGGVIPAGAGYHLVLSNNNNLVIQGGFIGNGGQFFMFYNPSTYYLGTGNKAAGTIPHFGAAGGYLGYCFFSNVSLNAHTVTVAQYDDAGLLVKGAAVALPALGRAVFPMANLATNQFSTVQITTNNSGTRTLCAYLASSNAVGSFAVSIATPQ